MGSATDFFREFVVVQMPCMYSVKSVASLQTRRGGTIGLAGHITPFPPLGHITPFPPLFGSSSSSSSEHLDLPPRLSLRLAIVPRQTRQAHHSVTSAQPSMAWKPRITPLKSVTTTPRLPLATVPSSCALASAAHGLAEQFVPSAKCLCII